MEKNSQLIHGADDERFYEWLDNWMRKTEQDLTDAIKEWADYETQEETD